ncbi:hypothetical protein ACFPES_07640 [Paenibacillus sp. GCM10023248]|nr:hypothetical protein [Paenibacillus sp. MAHUQ-63]
MSVRCTGPRRSATARPLVEEDAPAQPGDSGTELMSLSTTAQTVRARCLTPGSGTGSAESPSRPANGHSSRYLPVLGGNWILTDTSAVICPFGARFCPENGK